MISFTDRTGGEPAFIAIVTSTFVARASRDREATLAENEVSDAERIDRRFDDLERKLDLLMAARETPGS